MNEQLLTAMCIELLEEFLEDAYENGPNEDLPVQQAFVYRQARNIADLADDVHALESDGRISSCFVLMRPLFESLMNVVAAVKSEHFSAQKMIAELEHDIGKITRWQKSEKDSQPGLFADTIQLLSEYAMDMRQEFNISQRRKWTTWDVAQVAKLEHHYMREYFMFSRNAHASTGGIIAQEYECGREMILQSTSYIVLSALGHAVQAVPCRHAQSYVNQTTRLLEFWSGEKEREEANSPLAREDFI